MQRQMRRQSPRPHKFLKMGVMRANSLNTHRKREEVRIDSTPELPNVVETVSTFRVQKDPKIKSHFRESLNNVIHSKGKKVRIATVVMVADESTRVHTPTHWSHQPLKSSLVMRKEDALMQLAKDFKAFELYAEAKEAIECSLKLKNLAGMQEKLKEIKIQNDKALDLLHLVKKKSNFEKETSAAQLPKPTRSESKKTKYNSIQDSSKFTKVKGSLQRLHEQRETKQLVAKLKKAHATKKKKPKKIQSSQMVTEQLREIPFPSAKIIFKDKRALQVFNRLKHPPVNIFSDRSRSESPEIFPLDRKANRRVKDTPSESGTPKSIMDSFELRLKDFHEQTVKRKYALSPLIKKRAKIKKKEKQELVFSEQGRNSKVLDIYSPKSVEHGESFFKPKRLENQDQLISHSPIIESEHRYVRNFVRQLKTAVERSREAILQRKEVKSRQHRERLLSSELNNREALNYRYFDAQMFPQPKQKYSQLDLFENKRDSHQNYPSTNSEAQKKKENFLRKVYQNDQVVNGYKFSFDLQSPKKTELPASVNTSLLKQHQRQKLTKLIKRLKKIPKQNQNKSAIATFYHKEGGDELPGINGTEESEKRTKYQN